MPRLRLKWAFGFPTGVSANAQPSVVSGRVFVGSDNGYFYSLDARTGCVYWSFEAGSIIRNAPTVGPITGQGAARYAVYFGDGHANVYALDAQTGRQLWKTKADPHVVARITAGSTLYGGKLFVPVSSSEEFSSGNPGYSCCTARGSVVALDANTGKEIWKAWVVPEEPKPWLTQPNGVVLYKPAGGAVWNAPTVDPVRGAVYFGTGDATTGPPAVTTDAIMAVDINTGKLLWHYQATEGDVFMGGCNGAEKSPACPTPMGPDMDIGNSPILVNLPDGKRAVLAGTKSADVVALDPDASGKLLYRVNAAGGQTGGTRFGRGTIVWGGASDGQRVYYGMGGAGLAALNPATGQSAWTFTRAGAHGRRTRRRPGRGANRGARRGLRGRLGRNALRAVGHGWIRAVVVRHRAAVRDGESSAGQGRRDQRVGRRGGERDAVRGIGLCGGQRRLGRKCAPRFRSGLILEPAWRAWSLEPVLFAAAPVLRAALAAAVLARAALERRRHFVAGVQQTAFGHGLEFDQLQRVLELVRGDDIAGALDHELQPLLARHLGFPPHRAELAHEHPHVWLVHRPSSFRQTVSRLSGSRVPKRAPEHGRRRGWRVHRKGRARRPARP